MANFTQRVVKRCYRCNSREFPQATRTILLDKISYTLCFSCLEQYEKLDQDIFTMQCAERESICKWIENQNKLGKKRLKKYDDKRHTSLRIILNGGSYETARSELG